MRVGRGPVEEQRGAVRCGATLRSGLILLQVVLNEHYLHKNVFIATLNEPLLLNAVTTTFIHSGAARRASVGSVVPFLWGG